MNDDEFIGKYLNGSLAPKGRHHHRRRNAVYWAIPIAAMALAYVVGKRPPLERQVIYEEHKTTAPIKQAYGYDKDFFSTLDIIDKQKRMTQFSPSTAVKRFDGTETYYEKSRQAQQLYFVDGSLQDLHVRLWMPSKPSGIYLGDHDYSFYAQPSGKGYEIAFIIDEKLLQRSASKKSEQEGGKGSWLELFIYYEGKESQKAKEDPTIHKEDAERYLINIVR